MPFFDTVLNKIQSLPGFGDESSALRKTGNVFNRLDNSASAAGVLGALGPATYFVEPDILETVFTGEGPSPVKMPHVLGAGFQKAAEGTDTIRGSAVAAGFLGATGPFAFAADSDILKSIVGIRGSHDYGKPQS